MDQHDFALWLAPGGTGPAPRGLDSWTQAGLPALTLPAGSSSVMGLPLGIQLIGRPASDESLLAWGAQIEEALA
jgi:Asp-tRNA(Asn)/Glu-tRNA(Gln) amidotransferase A subunit family amidase